MGKFKDILKSGKAGIQEARIQAVSDKARKLFTRSIEDMKDKIKDFEIKLEENLDLFTDSGEMDKAKNFNEKEWVREQIDLCVKIANAELSLEVAEKRFKELF